MQAAPSFKIRERGLYISVGQSWRRGRGGPVFTFCYSKLQSEKEVDNTSNSLRFVFEGNVAKGVREQ